MTTQLIKVAGWAGKPRGHVVFVHGLGGHAYDTWTSGDNIDSFWPLWLADDIGGICVWTLSYKAPAVNWLGTAPPIQDRAVTILHELKSTPELSNAPVAFICHSLGGLIIKQMLRTAEQERKHHPEIEALMQRVRAVIFIATPHFGSNYATWLDRLRFIFWPSPAAQDLVRNSAMLRDLNNWYRDWAADLSHEIYFELEATAVGTVVGPDSADASLPKVRPVGVDADHVQIAKPVSKTHQPYKGIRHFIDSKILSSRAQTQRTKAEIVELPKITQSTSFTWIPMAVRVAFLATIIFAIAGFSQQILQAIYAKPTVVLMDSIRKIYGRPKVVGEMNGDVIANQLADMEVKFDPWPVNSKWRRDDDVISEEPDLIVIHHSSFHDGSVSREWSDRRFLQFLSSVLRGSPDTKILIYSRMKIQGDHPLDQVLIRSMPSMRNEIGKRIYAFDVKQENGDPFSFENTLTVQQLKKKIRDIIH